MVVLIAGKRSSIEGCIMDCMRELFNRETIARYYIVTNTKPEYQVDIMIL